MSYCHPSYTPQECKHYCEQNPSLCRPPNTVPEPDVVGLLVVAAVAAFVVKKLRSK